MAPAKRLINNIQKGILKGRFCLPFVAKVLISFGERFYKKEVH
jgi:hypothetical protein